MSIKFSAQEKEILIHKLQAYMSKELDFELGQFDGDFLLDFISEEMGAYFYNRGLYDAKLRVEEKIAQIDEALYEIEQPTSLR
ncbi:DUF2164 domain-containing protein [Glaciecola sp. MH2013]|uniref:DUF2164 domain-containing protein n=1 Tax=Glaciecola sp. MH2013 TaxID=2785524 RepID=UPI00189FA69B|nr:DUF2164 domain-containing protein [Glaciecola sp. MH2013]MBF7071912.1 DUF2164 domain-containing protein [Glaciecola sp. MH2013]